ncbi:MAG: four-carbon acid sugar kinase family protein [Candidatus Bathyarchaeia archaeon]
MYKFVVIADDFTGACDVGAKFKKYNLETVVLTRIKDPLKFMGYDVVVIDSESRNDAPHKAYKKIRRIIAYLKKTGLNERLCLVYKKIDSTLRGNIGAEISAIIDELNLSAIIVAPSFPEMGRVALNGRLFVNGVPLEETDFARDLKKPVKTSFIPDIIKEQFNGKVGLIPLSNVRGGEKLLAQAVEDFANDGCKVIVVDAENANDLRIIAKVALNVGALPCGSAGLAESISYWLASSLHDRNVIVFSGSTNSATLNQIRRAGMERSIKVLKLRFPETFIEREKELNRLVTEVGQAFSEWKDVIITSAESKEDVSAALQIARSLGLKREEAAERILDIFGELAAPIFNKFRIAGIIIVGGDTAIKILKHIQAHGVRIKGEIMPGIPYSIVLGGNLDGKLVITKAGGFGENDAILRVITEMKKLSLHINKTLDI